MKMKRSVNGVLLLDKPKGLSSNQILQKVKNLYAASKAGHTGTLDPLATGLLPVCFGEATKFAHYLLDADKEYIATLKLGQATQTGDAEGEVIEESSVVVTSDAFQVACHHFEGVIQQQPPMFSALKHEGKPLYDYARKGIIVERKSREVTIYQIVLLEFDNNQAVIRVVCSKGTYIRTLVEDIARYLGTVAHLTDLRRIKTAGFSIQQASQYELLAQMTSFERDKQLLPCDVLVQHIPSLQLERSDILLLQQGKRIMTSIEKTQGDIFRAYSIDEQFIGIVSYDSQQNQLKAIRLMSY